MIPARRKRPKMMQPKDDAPIRCQGHLKWIRGHECACFEREWCGGKIEAAHVRIGTDGGVGMKPGDNWTIPLCSYHHTTQHNVGERTFEKDWRIDMKATALALWKASPHRIKLEQDARRTSASPESPSAPDTGTPQ